MDPVKTATGGNAPKKNFLVLSADDIAGLDDVKTVRDYIKVDRIHFEVSPGGFAQVPLQEECRALCNLEDFDTMYDLSMQYLAGKQFSIYITNDDGSNTVLGCMTVQDKFTDLRFMQCVCDYPWLVTWFTEFVAGYLAKKFPLPGLKADPQAVKEKKKGQKTAT